MKSGGNLSPDLPFVNRIIGLRPVWEYKKRARSLKIQKFAALDSGGPSIPNTSGFSPMIAAARKLGT